jgi:hypothetical protein
MRWGLGEGPEDDERHGWAKIHKRQNGLLAAGPAREDNQKVGGTEHLFSKTWLWDEKYRLDTPDELISGEMAMSLCK